MIIQRMKNPCAWSQPKPASRHQAEGRESLHKGAKCKDLKSAWEGTDGDISKYLIMKHFSRAHPSRGGSVAAKDFQIPV